MYNEDVTRIPVDTTELWKVLRKQFDYVRHVLRELPVETKEEALEVVHHRVGDRITRAGMAVIRYRDEGGEIGQRDHFLQMGRSLLPYIDQALDEKELTAEFVQQWGKIMFCHGYIASYVFDDTDDLHAERNRRKGAEKSKRQSQHVFLARLLLWFMNEKKQPRKQAEASAAKAISAFIDTGDQTHVPVGYDLKWFRSLLARDHSKGIVTTMSQDNKREAELRELAKSDLEGLPSIELVLSATHF